MTRNKRSSPFAAGAIFWWLACGLIPVAYGATPREELDRLPLSGGSRVDESLSETLLINGIDAELRHYRAAGESSGLKESYARMLRERGWKLYDVYRDNSGIQCFSKDGLFLYLVSDEQMRGFYVHMLNRSLTPLYQYLRAQIDPSMSGQGSDYYVLVTGGLIEVCKFLGIAVPQVGGNDPQDVPLYPTAIRKTAIERLSAGGGFYLYSSTAELEEIEKFYRYRWQYSGWNLDAEEGLSDQVVRKRFGLVPGEESVATEQIVGTVFEYSRADKTQVQVYVTDSGLLDMRLISILVKAPAP
jgi:hypothetical protein